MILRRTMKLPAVFAAGHAAGPAPAPDAEDCYANLLWLDRRNWLLLTHAATLFSVFGPTCAQRTRAPPAVCSPM